MFNFERTVKQGKKPDMTPLIDVIFQLILFFMLTTTFVNVEALNVFVNDSTAGEVQNLPENTASISAPISVSLKADDVYLAGKRVDKDNLEVILGRELKLDSNRQVKLVTQKGVSVQSLVSAIDLISKSGGVNIMLDAEGLEQPVSSMPPVAAPALPVLPELKSTKDNAARFDFDNPSGWMQQ